jgi:hypothetical protein
MTERERARRERERARRERERARRDAQRRASSINEFCDRNDVCRDTAYKEIRLKRLRARKVGKRTLIFPEDEQAWRDSLPILELEPTT